MHCIVPHVVSSLCCFATPGAPERSGTGGGPQPWPRRVAPLALLPGHVLQQAFVWLSHGVVEMAWPVPKPDISSKRAEQCMGEKGKHEHLLPSSRYAATRAQLRAHRSLHSNLLPAKKEGSDPPSYRRAGDPRAASAGREVASEGPCVSLSSPPAPWGNARSLPLGLCQA